MNPTPEDSQLNTRSPSEIEAAESKFLVEGMPPGWREIFKTEVASPYFKTLTKFLNEEMRLGRRVYPNPVHIFRSFRELDLDQIRVVILGQDPYHGESQAIGRAFAVANNTRPKPPSLKNICKEIIQDLGCTPDLANSELSGWVEQGVFLLNTVLTVRAGEPFSHRDQGWEIFTDKVITVLGRRQRPLVFLLWGAAAQKKRELILNPRHLILESPHPSPFSANRGFFGCRHFSKTNAFLEKTLAEKPIEWARL
jgi:uracil-DNA glycosylase